MFQALSSALESKDGVTLRYFAARRVEEIFKKGGRSLSPKTLNLRYASFAVHEADINYYGVGVNNQNQKTLDELFPQLRAEAENWNTARQNYMLARLQKGDHPDWNKHFWDEWKPTAPPSLDVPWINQAEQNKTARKLYYARNEAIFRGVVAAILVVAGLGLWRLSKRYLSV